MLHDEYRKLLLWTDDTYGHRFTGAGDHPVLLYADRSVVIGGNMALFLARLVKNASQVINMDPVSNPYFYAYLSYLHVIVCSRLLVFYSGSMRNTSLKLL